MFIFFASFEFIKFIYIVIGDSEAAKHFLDASTLSMVGLEYQGTTLEARLHGNVNEEMFNAEDADGKFAVLARASQATSVALDALTVHPT